MKYAHLIILTMLSFMIIFGCSSNKDAQDGDRITDRELLDVGDQQFNSGQYKDALNSYKLLLSDYPTSDLHIDAQLKIAATYSKLEDYDSQMDALISLLKENIIPEQVPQIYTQIGMFYEDAAHFNPHTVTSDTIDYQKALEYYKKAFVYKDSDDTNSKAHAAYRRALVEAKLGNIGDATSQYKVVSVYFPQSDYAVLANLKLVDPSDISELSIHADSIAVYRESLNMPAPEQEVQAPEEVPIIQDSNAGSGDVDESVFGETKADTTGTE